jgi:hypothetical protein
VRLQAPGDIGGDPVLVARKLVRHDLRDEEFNLSRSDEVFQRADHRLLPIIFGEIQPDRGVDEQLQRHASFQGSRLSRGGRQPLIYVGVADSQ